MKRYIGVVVLLVGAVAGMIYMSKRWDQKTLESQRDLNAARIRNDYLERVPWIRVNPDEKAYKDEVSTLFRWYFKEVNEHINKYGGNRKFDEYLTELDERTKKKKGGDDSNFEQKKAAYDYVRKFFDDFQGGKYDPLYTSTNNSLRWDIVRTEPIGEKIRFTFVLWGVPGEERVLDERGTKKWVTSVSFKSNWKMYDEKGKLFGEMPAEGVDMKDDSPQRRIRWFPPQVIVGHFEIPKIPAEVKDVEISFTQTTRSLTGREIAANHAWKMPLPAEWKLPAGQKWEGATDSVRPEEEINARTQAAQKKQ